MKYLRYVVCIVLVIVAGSITAPSAVAEGITITISDNGSGSENSVDVSSSNTTDVSVSNTSETTNDVSTTADTGNNDASGNTGGEVTIDTGNIDVTTTVENTVNTTDITANGCGCDGGLTVEVSGNGSDSQNNVTASSTTNTSITVEQNATLTNTVTTTANTGGNTANDNVGDVTINTGNITGQANVKNAANITDIDVATGGFADMYLSIFGNGSGSQSNIDITLLNNTVITKLENAFVENFLNTDANTGDNSANNNLGAVLIGTGDITFLTNVINDPINSNTITVGCCGDPGIPPVIPPDGNGRPIDQNGKSNNPNPTGGGDDDPDESEDSETGGGDVLGAFGEVLPATGIPINHFAILMMSLLFLLSGLLLKLGLRKRAYAFA